MGVPKGPKSSVRLKIHFITLYCFVTHYSSNVAIRVLIAICRTLEVTKPTVRKVVPCGGIVQLSTTSLAVGGRYSSQSIFCRPACRRRCDRSIVVGVLLLPRCQECTKGTGRDRYLDQFIISWGRGTSPLQSL